MGVDLLDLPDDDVCRPDPTLGARPRVVAPRRRTFTAGTAPRPTGPTRLRSGRLGRRGRRCVLLEPPQLPVVDLAESEVDQRAGRVVGHQPRSAGGDRDAGRRTNSIAGVRPGASPEQLPGPLECDGR